MNVFTVFVVSASPEVLIDTWWNVNLTSTGYVRRDFRSFNRYMVECELRYREKFFSERSSFNRYMVECE